MTLHLHTPAVHPRALFACVIAACGAFLFGYDGGAFIGSQLFIRQHFAMSPLMFGTVTSAILFGCLLATAVGSRMQERLGARTCLGGAAVLFVAGSLGASLSANVALLGLCRLVAGVATGIISIAAPMYITEVAPLQQRGRFGLLYQLALTIGSLLGLGLGWLLATTLPPEFAWRWLLGSTTLPSLALLVLLAKIPESPRWLLAQGREAKAQAVLQTIRDPGEIQGELDAIRTGAAGKEGSFRDLLGPGIRWALLTGMLLGVFNNWTGGTGVGSYLPVLFQHGGFSSAGNALAVSLLVTCVNVGFTVVSLWLVGRVGRRVLWMTTAGGMTVSVALLGWAFHAGVTGPAMLGLTLLVVICHALGLAPLPWLMISELYSGPLRVRAISICTTVLWLSGFTCVLAFPLLAAWSERHLGSVAGVFWVFAGMSLLALLFGWRLLPETRGQSLEAIARHFHHQTAPMEAQG